MGVYQEGQRAFGPNTDCPYTDWRQGTWIKGYEAARLKAEERIAAAQCSASDPDSTELTQGEAQAFQALESLRSEGYAVIIWSPAELGDVDPGRVEELSIEKGWDIIATLTGEEHENT